MIPGSFNKMVGSCIVILINGAKLKWYCITLLSVMLLLFILFAINYFGTSINDGL